MKLFAPILSTYRAYANMTRIRKILGVVFRNGLGIFFGKLRHLVRRRERNDGSSAELTIQERVRKVLEELGPVYVKVGQMLNGSVYNITDTGAFVFTDERFIAFVPHKEMPERPRVGADVKIRVTFLRDDGRLNGSMRDIKEKAISIDGEKILYLLQQHNGRMPYSDDSSPEMIKSKFKISKRT